MDTLIIPKYDEIKIILFKVEFPKIITVDKIIGDVYEYCNTGCC